MFVVVTWKITKPTNDSGRSTRGLTPFLWEIIKNIHKIGGIADYQICKSCSASGDYALLPVSRGCVHNTLHVLHPWTLLWLFSRPPVHPPFSKFSI